MVLLRGISERKFLYLIVSGVSFIFIMLTLRRTVMGLSALAILVALLTMMTQRKAKMVFITGGLMLVTGYFIYSNTNFLQSFKERVEQRKLDERDLAEEKRFIEYSLLYDDMFVYHAYSPWFGYELFNSGGNYGKGVLAERSLHGDIPNLLHSSGVIGVLLYLFMVGTAFWQAIKAAKRYQDKLIVLFCALSFLVYTVTGRYTEVAATGLLFLVLMLPLAKQETPLEDEIPGTKSKEPEIRTKSQITKTIDEPETVS
jgi:cell division protein FtsW (lipid II flippase)